MGTTKTTITYGDGDPRRKHSVKKVEDMLKKVDARVAKGESVVAACKAAKVNHSVFNYYDRKRRGLPTKTKSARKGIAPQSGNGDSRPPAPQPAASAGSVVEALEVSGATVAVMGPPSAIAELKRLIGVAKRMQEVMGG